MQETQVWEDPPEERIATHSRILAWRIPWTEEPGGLRSMGSQRVIISLKIRETDPFILLFQITSALPGPLSFQLRLVIILSLSTKNTAERDRDSIQSLHQFGKNGHLCYAESPIHELSHPPHSSRSLSVSSISAVWHLTHIV